MTSASSKLHETINAIQSEAVLPEGYDKYIDNLTKDFLEQSIQDKYHYSKILMMHILNKLDYRKKPVESFDITELKCEEQIIPNDFYYKNLAATINDFKYRRQYFSNLIDIITFGLIPSLFLMFLDEKAFDDFIELIMNLSTSEEDIDFQILLSRSIFFSPIFLQFTNSVFYQLLKSPYINLFYLDNAVINNNYFKDFQKALLNSIKTNIHMCPLTIIKFLKAFQSKSKLTLVQILKKCIFDPIIANPSIFLVNDVWISEIKNESEKISSILKFTLTDEIVEQIGEIFETNDSYFNPFLNKNNFNVDHQFIIYHRIIDMIDLVSMNQIQSILKGDEPSKDILDLIYDKGFKEYSLYSCHFDGEINPWICIRQILKKSSQFPETLNNNSENDENDNQIKLSDFLELLKNNLPKQAPIKILFNQVQSFFNENPDLFSQEELLNQLELMKEAPNIEEEKITIDEINNFPEKMKKIKNQKRFVIDEMRELFFTFITRDIKHEKIEIPFKIHVIMQKVSEFTHQFEEYLSFCKKESKIISRNHNFNNIFYHRYWQNLRFNGFLAERTELHKYDSILRDFLSKNYSKLAESYIHPIHERDKILKSVAFAMNNVQLFESQLSQTNIIFECNDDPLAKFQNFVKVFDSFAYLIQKSLHIISFQPDDKYGLEEIFLGLANPSHFISNIIYFNQFINTNSYDNYRPQFHFLLRFINERINGLIPNYNFPMFYLFKYLTFYITGDDLSLIASAYKSIMNIFNPKKTPKTEEDLNEFVQYFDKNNSVPEKFALENNFKYVDMGSVYIVNLIVCKKLRESNIEIKPNSTTFGVFASSCSDYQFEKPEEKFFKIKKLDLKIFVYRKNANLRIFDSPKFNGALLSQSDKLIINISNYIHYC